MPSVKLNRAFGEAQHTNSLDLLPHLLQTPVGLAIIEIQGTLHFPTSELSNAASQELGRLEFPNHTEDQDVSIEGKWMKGVRLYIGQHQRLVGEVKKLPKPMVLLKRDPKTTAAAFPMVHDKTEIVDQLDIVAIVRYKILFSSRPEPVGM